MLSNRLPLNFFFLPPCVISLFHQTWIYLSICHKLKYIWNKQEKRTNIMKILIGIWLWYVLVWNSDAIRPESQYLFIFILYREEITRGYMSNLELEKSIKEFGKRCAKISHVYRYIKLSAFFTYFYWINEEGSQVINQPICVDLDFGYWIHDGKSPRTSPDNLLSHLHLFNPTF